ncbi:MAG TPA: carboxypeptidase-like regulatory domain-containing protein [Terriglobales bacterium]|nr:carboxypeptidase-like regulatory domain-containing protein [Terriglobales bacterium]
MTLQLKFGLIELVVFILAWMSYCLAQSPEQAPPHDAQQAGATSKADPLPVEELPGIITGTVVDQSGALVAGARIKLADSQTLNKEVLSGPDGQFSFTNIAPGNFQLTITSPGFAAQTVSGVLHSGENDTLPQIVLVVATNVTEVQVGVPQTEVAQEQIKIQETQRVLGTIPNFYVSYIPNAAPLNTKQKFELAWKTVVDPVTFLVVGGLAGVQQAQNHFVGYGQGAQGYAKRFGANYADTVSGTFIGSAILASLLKQDPRYFYKGTGRATSRFLYAVANSVICKGDNRRWQPNYSNVLGNLASGGISNLYYPSQDRNGAELTFENAAVGIGAGSISNVLQEFLLRKLTPHTSRHSAATPAKKSINPN